MRVGAENTVEVMELAPDGRGMRVALVSCRVNRSLAEGVVAEAVGRLRRHGVADGDMTVIMAPSVVSILPIVRRAVADSGYDAVVVAGAILMDGDTEGQVDAAVIANGLSYIIRGTEKPIGVGMLFAENLEQGMSQLGSPDGIGETAAVSVIELYHAARRLGG